MAIYRIDSAQLEPPPEPEPPEQPEDGPRGCAGTEALRAAASALGVRYTRGYVLAGGRRVNEDNVTTLYPACVTVSEDADGNMWVEDPVTPLQALAVAMAGE